MPELKDDPRAISLMEKKLLDVIVNNNLYKDHQLNLLFDEFRVANNRSLNRELIEEAIRGVQKTLDE